MGLRKLKVLLRFFIYNLPPYRTPNILFTTERHRASQKSLKKDLELTNIHIVKSWTDLDSNPN